jgi:hypothetical protein
MATLCYPLVYQDDALLHLNLESARFRARAIPELLYPGTIGLEWHSPQENAAFHDFRKGMVILESL